MNSTPPGGVKRFQGQVVVVVAASPPRLMIQGFAFVFSPF